VVILMVDLDVVVGVDVGAVVAASATVTEAIARVDVAIAEVVVVAAETEMATRRTGCR